MANELDIKSYFSNVINTRKKELEEAEKQLDEVEKKADDVKTEEESNAVVDEATAVKARIEALKAELAEAEKQLASLDEPAPADDNKQGEARSLTKLIEKRGSNKMDEQQNVIEERAKKFAETDKMTISQVEARAMLVSSGKIATPTKVSGINELNNEVSSIVDMVDIEDCEGMGSDKVAYEFTAPSAGTTTEGQAYQTGDTVVDFVTITPETITTISSISKQVRKQSPLKYEEKVRKNAMNALRKKASANIVSKIYASKLNKEITDITAIDEKTLRKIALGYGGDENVAGNAVLFLNKADLVAFGDVRGTSNKNAVYEITPDASNPNIGTIKDGGLTVKYCINSNCKALTGATAGSAKTHTMFYGQPVKCKLDLFSDYEVAVSEDYQFDKGLLTIRGDAEIGVDVVFKDGFNVVTLPATGA